eukprot:1151186-Pelagomonas_calceolata.AAC.17
MAIMTTRLLTCSIGTFDPSQGYRPSQGSYLYTQTDLTRSLMTSGLHHFYRMPLGGLWECSFLNWHQNGAAA